MNGAKLSLFDGYSPIDRALFCSRGNYPPVHHTKTQRAILPSRFQLSGTVDRSAILVQDVENHNALIGLPLKCPIFNYLTVAMFL